MRIGRTIFSVFAARISILATVIWGDIKRRGAQVAALLPLLGRRGIISVPLRRHRQGPGRTRQASEGLSPRNGARMDQPARTCPKCGSSDYLFRSRKQIEEEQGPMLETKFRCKNCGKEWKEKAPGVLRKGPRIE